MNPLLQKLQPYPFEKLAALKADCSPPDGVEHIALSLGEPRHPSPEVALAPLRANLDQLNRYPLTKGMPELRLAIADWLQRRFQLDASSIDPERQVIPVNGTREALFAFAQCIVAPGPEARVMMPNPFYQIYEGAALLSGAQPYFYSTLKHNSYLPDFDAIDEQTWQRCQLIYICTPGNPTGAVLSEKQLASLIEKARQYDFVIASDECYSEIYFDEAAPPTGLLQAAFNNGNRDFTNCIVFHSLSKRSNLPGMRSGFVAGDADIIRSFLLYRTYHGCAMPPTHQLASIAAWNDETHVQENRRLYRAKFDAVLEILAPVSSARKPDAGFYIWLNTPIADTDFSQQLFNQQNVTVLPGSYLSREVNGSNPGSRHVRMALVASVDECIDAANRIKQFIQSLN
ncbi:MAG: succinyldiaminopimelate transaminase [Gammaproteobacteria bacterium]|nr:succinyldiaminopimelate transaminase [Gammaproteobacteria bacterium]